MPQIEHVWSTFSIVRWVKAMGGSVVGWQLVAGRAAPWAKFNVQQQSPGLGGDNNGQWQQCCICCHLHWAQCQQRATLPKEFIATQQIQMTQHNRVGAMAAGIMIGS
jgi:hypothetical protein